MSESPPRASTMAAVVIAQRSSLMIAVRSSVIVLTLAFAAALPAQLIVPDKNETVPAFEVSTVKPSSKDLGRSYHSSVRWNNSSYSTENMTLRNLIRSAFNANSAPQLTGGSDALLDARWDINAKIAEDDYVQLQKLPSDDRFRVLRLMVQALLADRFGLKVHIETRELPVFDLVVDKAGSKLHPAAPLPAAPSATDAPASSSSTPAKPREGSSTNTSRDHGTMTATSQTLANLAAMLGRQPELDGRIVIDKTGLTGKYDWTLEWHPLNMNATDTDTDATGPSLFSALKSQLGLHLESFKGPVQIVVVDAVSSPTPN